MNNQKSCIVKITPSSFGSVISLKKDNLYDRFFFLHETTEYFRNISKSKTNNISAERIEGMELITKKYGLNSIKQITRAFNENEKYFKLIDKILEETKWKLFSLLPLKLSMELINTCTNKCPWCYKDAKQIKPIEVNPQMLYSVKDTLSKFASHIAYSGGEPLLNRNIFRYLSYKNYETYDVLTTSLVPNINLAELIKTQVDLVQVSIHGYKEAHDKIIGIDGIWNKIIQKMLFLGKHLDVATNIVISEENLYSLPLLIKFIEKNILKKVRYKYTRIVLASPSGRGYKTIKPSNKSLVKRLLSMVSELEEQYPMLNFEIPAKHSNPFLYFEESGKLVCPAGTVGCEINLNGKIRPCNIFNESISTDKSVIDNDFFDVWLNSKLFHKFRNGYKLGACEKCSDKKYCIGDCNYLLLNKKKIIKCFS